MKAPRLWQKFRQYPVPADAEAAAPLDDLLGDLAEIFPTKISVPEPAIEIYYRQHHPIAVLGPVGNIVGDQRVDHLNWQLLRTHRLNFRPKFFGQFHIIPAKGPNSSASAITSSKRMIHAASALEEDSGIWNCRTFLRHSASNFLSNSLAASEYAFRTTSGLSLAKAMAAWKCR